MGIFARLLNVVATLCALYGLAILGLFVYGFWNEMPSLENLIRFALVLLPSALPLLLNYILFGKFRYWNPLDASR